VGSVVAGHARAPQLKDGDGHAVYRLSRVFQGNHTADRPGRPGLSHGRDLKQTCRQERSHKCNQMPPDRHDLSSIKICIEFGSPYDMKNGHWSSARCPHPLGVPTPSAQSAVSRRTGQCCARCGISPFFQFGADSQVSDGGPRMRSAVTVGYETDAKSFSKLLVEKEEGRAKFVSGKTDWPRALWKKHMLHSGD